MTADPAGRRPARSGQHGRAARTRRRIARAVVVLDFLVLMGLLIALANVDINDHPGLVVAVFVAVAVFVVAFPFVGFRNASPGDREQADRGE